MSLLKRIEAKLAEVLPTHVLSDAHRVILDEVHAVESDLEARIAKLETTISEDRHAIAAKFEEALKAPLDEFHRLVDAIKARAATSTAVPTTSAPAQPAEVTVASAQPAPEPAAAPAPESLAAANSADTTGASNG